MSEPMPTPGDAAKDEAARQAVLLVFSVAGMLIMIAAQRAAGDPDFYRTVKMRFAKASERVTAKVAWKTWQLAEKARLRYEQESA